ncbi:ATP-binding cassette domain-containing protein [Sulfidibacter corallicola]|uniref:ATP-binding cassette domain-containing protein n=1 Tax=Sulfidibacter corallicola TaxID=2818388 RepID=A0A8A4TT47_SULCO|nr:ATP-binding cassette domain-containing protein [Sulfidibacter corallicola]QTD53129.1 ATP-binding cassette domain-containing protein [Sulfidibacter corallicola]
MTVSCSTEPPLIRIENLCFGYPGHTEKVLDGLDLLMAPGERIAIMGRSGVGKSTLLNILALLQDFETGDFTFNRRKVKRQGRRQKEQMRSAWIGMVFQAHYLIPYLTVRENVDLALELAPRRVSFGRAEALIDAVGLSHRAHFRPNQLSGGEQQRVGLARALAKEPLLLLADEPTGNLDEETGLRILDLLLDRDMYRGAVITVTHQKQVASLFTRRYRLAKGRLHPLAASKSSGVTP